MRLALFVLLLAAPPSQAEEIIYVQYPAELAPDASIAKSVLEQCQVERRVGGPILDGVMQYNGRRTRVAGPENGSDKILRLTILNVIGVGGGRYSGRKIVQVRADIVQSGAVLSSREFEREMPPARSRRSRQGTCALLERLGQRLGKAVGMWLPFAEYSGAPASAATADPAQRMHQLKKLLDEGLINDREYEQKRVELLRTM